MGAVRKPQLLVVGVVMLMCQLHLRHCRAIAADHGEVPTRTQQLAQSTAFRTQPSVPLSFDSKAKLTGFNRALSDRLQRTRTDLRPLQARATQLQQHYDSFQRRHRSPTDPKSLRTERNALLQEATRLRTAVEGKLQGFGALDQRYRHMRTLLRSNPQEQASALPRAWLDRDTERQIELNERVYKNIIDLLVHLIECPVNIIHDVLGPALPAPSSTPPPPTEEPTDGDETENDATTLYYEPIESDASVGEPWLEEFHY
uniref:Uncharacterized protein n=1 Tax=Anopheles dirus TaxID=7168 RepID=A0A182N4S3_9DIPT